MYNSSIFIQNTVKISHFYYDPSQPILVFFFISKLYIIRCNRET